MWAAGRPTMAALVRARADTNAVDTTGKSVLMFLACRGDDAAIETLCDRPGVNMDWKTKAGMSAYDLALSLGYPQTADLLVQLGAQAPSKTSAGAVVKSAAEALQEAARNGDAATCRELLQRDAALVDNAEHGGETPLLTAASHAGRTGTGGFETLEVLLEAGANPSFAEGYLGETPLMRLARNGGGEELIWLLLEAKADASALDLTGKTAVDIARSWKRDDAAEILEAALVGELPLSGMD